MKNRIVITLFFFLPITLQSQILVSDGATVPNTPISLLNDFFIQNEVEVLDIQFDGSAQAVGSFHHFSNEAGLEKGVVITTGLVNTQYSAGMFGTAAAGMNFASNNNGSAVTDPDIMSIATNTPYNISRYTMVFRATGDSVRFRYVFASEEYPEYSCSAFADIFGFFLSGPGINGTFENNGINIALIPGTDTVVSVNSVHPIEGTQCMMAAYDQFYHNNANSTSGPVYDGYLNVFEAKAATIPCGIYTLKIVIADVGDTAFDSAIFLEAGSFSTNTAKTKVQTSSINGTIAEGCTPGNIQLSLPYPRSIDYTLSCTLTGTAENGTDFVYIPTELTIPAGETFIEIPVIALEDGISETEETIGIIIFTNECSQDTHWVNIKDNLLTAPVLPQDLSDCNPNPITLDATLPLISTPSYFLSNTTEILISPVNTAIYSPIEVTGYPGMFLTENMLRSICLNVNITWLDDIDVYLQAPDGQILELTTDNGGDGNNYIETCFVVDDNATVINAPGPYAPASAVPFTGDWLPEGDWSLLFDGQHPVNGTWKLILLDDQSGFTGSLIEWSMTLNSEYELQYAWTPEAGVSCPTCPITEVFPVENTVYQVVVSDSYGCAVSASTTIGGLAPEVEIQLNSPSCTATDMIDAAVVIQNGDIPYQIMWNTGDTLATLYNVTPGEYSVIITFENGCISTDTALVGTTISPVISASGITPVCTDQNTGIIELNVLYGQEPYQYIWNNGTTTSMLAGLNAGIYTVTVTDANGCTGALTLEIPLYTPVSLVLNAFASEGQNCGAEAIISSGIPPYAFLWSSGELSNPALALPAGEFSVTVTDGVGCTTIFNDICTIVSTNIAEKGVLYVSPNPSEGIFYINSEYFNEQALELSVFNSTGKHIFTQFVAKNAVDYPIDLTTCPAGLYLLQVKSPSGILLQSFLMKM